MLSDHDEQDDGTSKDVDLLTLVGLIKVDLRSHVIHGAKLSRQVSTAVSTLNWSSKTKVRNFESEILVQQKILWLQISVSNSLFVAVLQTRNELFEEVSGKRLIESSGDSNEVEELSSHGELEHDVLDLELLAVVFLVGADSELDLLDDVLVLEDSHCLHLSHDQLLGLVVDILLEDLDGNLAPSAGIETQFDRATGA